MWEAIISTVNTSRVQRRGFPTEAAARRFADGFGCCGRSDGGHRLEVRPIAIEEGKRMGTATGWFGNRSGTTSCYRGPFRLTVYEEPRRSGRFGFVVKEASTDGGRRPRAQVQSRGLYPSAATA